MKDKRNAKKEWVVLISYKGCEIAQFKANSVKQIIVGLTLFQKELTEAMLRRLWKWQEFVKIKERRK